MVERGKEWIHGLYDKENSLLYKCLKGGSEQGMAASEESSFTRGLEGGRPFLFWEMDRVKWKPANLSLIALGDILVEWDDGQIVDDWAPLSSNVSLSFDSLFQVTSATHTSIQCHTGIILVARLQYWYWWAKLSEYWIKRPLLHCLLRIRLFCCGRALDGLSPRDILAFATGFLEVIYIIPDRSILV